MEAEHGDIVKLRRVAHKAVHRAPDVFDGFLRGQRNVMVQGLQHTVRAKELVLGVRCLGYAVRIDEQAVAGMQLKGMLPETGALENGQGNRMTVYHQLILTILAPDRGMLMTRVDGQPAAGGDFDDRHPYGHEELRLVALAQLLVYVLQNFRRTVALLSAVLDQRFGNDHEQRGGHAFAGNVRHDQADMVVVDQEEIIEIAAHFLGGVHGGVQVKFLAFRERRENSRKHIGLNLCSNI